MNNYFTNNKKEKWYFLETKLNSYLRAKIFRKSILNRNGFSVFEIIFDIFVIASLRYISNNISFEVFYSSGTNTTHSIQQLFVLFFFIMQFFLIWLMWFYMIYFVQWFENNSLKSRLLFGAIFISISIFITTQYIFSMDLPSFNTNFNQDFYKLLIYNMLSLGLVMVVITIAFFSSVHELRDLQESMRKYFLQYMVKGFGLSLIVIFITSLLLLILQNEIIIWFGLLAILIILAINFFIIFKLIFYKTRKTEQEDVLLPFETNHLIERCGFLFCIALGEAIINYYDVLGEKMHDVLKDQHEALSWPFITRTFLVSALTTFTIFLLWWIYMDRVWSVKFTKVNPYIRIYLVATLIITSGIVFLAAGLSKAINHILSTNWTSQMNHDFSNLSLGFGLFFFGVALVAVNKKLIHKRENIKLKDSWNIIFSIDSILFAFISFFLLRTEINSLVDELDLFIVYLSMCMLSLFVGIWGWYKSIWTYEIKAINNKKIID